MDQYDGMAIGAYAVTLGLISILIKKGILNVDEARNLFDAAALNLEEMGLPDEATKAAHALVSLTLPIIQEHPPKSP